MRIVIFGLSVSSSWGNGHAALWRGLIGVLLRRGHRVTFFERDQPWYADHRDVDTLPDGGELVLYSDWATNLPRARAALDRADLGIVTSYCADGIAAAQLLQESRVAARCFYDLDTPITLARLKAGETVPYIPPEGLGGFDLVLSYTGGRALGALRDRLGAHRVVPLYGSADPRVHRPGSPRAEFGGILSYLGTYAEDRQPALERLFLSPARRRPQDRFVLAGAQYPRGFPWTENLFFVRHLPASEHPDFYASSRLTLNITRSAMARAGWCPSGRLFEAAACGAPILTDAWDGIAEFFEPDREILIADTTEGAMAALDRSPNELAAIARRARERVLAEHTASRRAEQLVAALDVVGAPA